jgi:hypothetical protein
VIEIDVESGTSREAQTHHRDRPRFPAVRERSSGGHESRTSATGLPASCFTGGVARWSIRRVQEVRPTHLSKAYAVFEVYFAEDDQAEPQMTVEYAIAFDTHHKRWASEEHARAAVEPYLDEPTPPRRLIVDGEGNVSVRGLAG